MYKGFPLVRCKNDIYFGDPKDPYVIFITILATDGSEEEIPTRVTVELLATDESIPIWERSQKKSEKNSLYDALDIGLIWLQRALSKKG
ncbi:MAG: hypothetical protein IJN82_01000 [Clostridia bacterium]|nr:hypothetical protein [Clostridia bacterium]MBQ7089676.1 hypothetical protein [Clostridia bacterium]